MKSLNPLFGKSGQPGLSYALRALGRCGEAKDAKLLLSISTFRPSSWVKYGAFEGLLHGDGNFESRLGIVFLAARIGKGHAVPVQGAADDAAHQSPVFDGGLGGAGIPRRVVIHDSSTIGGSPHRRQFIARKASEAPGRYGLLRVGELGILAEGMVEKGHDLLVFVEHEDPIQHLPR